MPSEESYKKIEGDFKDFRFRRIQDSDHSAVFEHIAQNYARDETVSSLLGWSQAYADDINRVVEFLLKDGLSFLVEHKETKKIACVRITYNRNPSSFEIVNKIPIHSRAGQLFFKFVNDIMGMADLTVRHGINSWAEFVIASTDREFRNQGLTGEMYDRSLAFLKAEGFQHAFVVVTSPWTKHATKKRGFQQQSRLDYENLMDYDGKPVFKKEDMRPGHHAFSMLKTFN